MNVATTHQASSRFLLARTTRFALALGLVGTLVVSPRSFAQIEIDPSQGQIDGRVAISFWPSDPADPESPLFPGGFTVHMVPSADPSIEMVEACGKWFQPPTGQYRFWLEGPNLISPESMVMAFSGGPFIGKGGVSLSPVAPAGHVALDDKVPIPENTSLRLLALGSYPAGGRLPRELARRVPREAAFEGVLMPEGKVLAALYDLKADEYLALAPPQPVRAGALTLVAPRPPSRASDLVVVLKRPQLLATKPEHDVSPEVSDPVGNVKEPDILVATAERIFAVWYGLDAKRVTLRAESPEVFLTPVDIPLRVGKIEQLRGDLRPLPSLDVELHLPNAFSGRDKQVSVRRRSDGNVVSQARLADGVTVQRFEHLPPAEFDVLLDIAPWLFYAQVDLTDGSDDRVVFEPQPIEITGTVYRGAKRHPATVAFWTFRSPADRVTTETDNSGSYETVLYRSGRYVAYVDLEGVDGPAFTDYLIHGITESKEIDFHVPDTSFRVRVVDHDSGEGIDGATVSADNEYVDEDGGPRTVSQPSVTDVDGFASLQPLRPGKVTVIASARGYRKGDPVVEPVAEGSEARELTLPLRKLARGDPLQILLADGSPAAGAEVQVRADLGNGPMLWEGVTDQAGELRLPAIAKGAFLLARHTRGAAAVRFWGGSSPPTSWILSRPGPPLLLRAEHSWGDPAPWAQIAVWLDGFRLHGLALAWLTRSAVAATDSHGLWRPELLPEVPLRILAWSNAETAQGLSGALDGLSVSISPPFPDVFDVVVVE